MCRLFDVSQLYLVLPAAKLPPDVFSFVGCYVHYYGYLFPSEGGFPSLVSRFANNFLLAITDSLIVEILHIILLQANLQVKQYVHRSINMYKF
jgi:hypothetical protein